jgi:hypothetical protein
VQGQAHTATQTETQTAAATTTTTTTTGFAVGLQRAVLGWGRHDGCLCCLCCLYRLYCLCCPGMRVRATLTATKRRGLPAGSAAKATCLESLLAQPPLASLPAGGTAHYPRTTHYALHRTAHCLVGRFSASWSRRPKSSSRRWRCWRRWRRWSRSPCHGGRAGVTYSRAAASWAMLDHCWTMPGAVVNPVPAAQTVQARWLATGW